MGLMMRTTISYKIQNEAQKPRMEVFVDTTAVAAAIALWQRTDASESSKFAFYDG